MVVNFCTRLKKSVINDFLMHPYDQPTNAMNRIFFALLMHKTVHRIMHKNIHKIIHKTLHRCVALLKKVIKIIKF